MDKSYGWLCSGVWEHGPQTPQPHDVTNQSLRFRPYPFVSTGLPYLRSLMELRVWLSCATRGCVSRETEPYLRTSPRNTTARELLVRERLPHGGQVRRVRLTGHNHGGPNSRSQTSGFHRTGMILRFIQRWRCRLFLRLRRRLIHTSG